MKTVICILACLCCGIVHAGEVRVSLLNDPVTLGDTLALLQGNGCTSSSIAAFSNAVTHYYQSATDIDLSKFPAPENGFYHFPAMSNLMAALDRPLWKSKHPFETTCFFVVLALSQATTDMKADDLAGPFLAIQNKDNLTWDTCAVATPREAFFASYGPEYLNDLMHITGMLPNDRDLSLLASFHTCTILPRYATEETLPQLLLATLKSKWQRQGVHFSTASSIVMLHAVDLKKYFRVLTDHAGILIRLGNGYMYLEKAGGAGPFVRIDLKSPNDLATYYNGYPTEEGRGDMIDFLLTIDDKDIKWIWPKQVVTPQPRTPQSGHTTKTR